VPWQERRLTASRVVSGGARTRELREVIVPLYLALSRLPQEYSVQLWMFFPLPHWKRKWIDQLQRVQQRLLRWSGLECFCGGEAEGTGLLQPGEEWALGTPIASLLVLTRRLSKRWSQAIY